MAGETVKTLAICMDIHPWSRTSHIVSWLTPDGRLLTAVKGAERPKSFFLGQYDMNYTCEVLYYLRGRGDVHALREVSPVNLRERLRSDFRALALASYCRAVVGELVPTGDECLPWYDLLTHWLDRLTRLSGSVRDDLAELTRFDLEVLALAGVEPDFSGYDRTAEWSAFSVERGSFGAAEAGRQVRISREVAEFLENPLVEIKKSQIPLDAARVISVFYQFHLDCAFDVRRTVLKLIS